MLTICLRSTLRKVQRKKTRPMQPGSFQLSTNNLLQISLGLSFHIHQMRELASPLWWSYWLFPNFPARRPTLVDPSLKRKSSKKKSWNGEGNFLAPRPGPTLSSQATGNMCWMLAADEASTQCLELFSGLWWLFTFLQNLLFVGKVLENEL